MTTWTQLQADVVAMTGRTDVADRISAAVGVFEARVRRNLRVAQMEAAFAGTIDANNEVAKPAGFLAFRAIWPDGYKAAQLKVQSLESVVAMDRTSGVPTVYAVQGDSFLFDGSGDVSGVYYQDLPGLVANETNWLSVAAYDAYLYGALSEVWDAVGEDAQAQKYLQRSGIVIESIAGADQRDRHNGPLVARKR